MGRGEPIGWNVYSGSGVARPAFIEFIPNGDVLDRVAEKFADEVEAFTAGADG